MSLITPEELLEHYRGLVDADSELLPKLIDRADSLMATFCGLPPYDSGGGARSLAANTYTLYLDAPTGQPERLDLGVRPLVSVTTVHVDATRAYAAATELTEGTDFDADLQLGLLVRAYGSTWPVGWRSSRVVCVAGFETAPPDLVVLVAASVQALIDRPNLQQLQSSTIGGQSVSPTDLDHMLPAAVRAELERSYAIRRCSHA